jgi:hypothetical protein
MFRLKVLVAKTIDFIQSRVLRIGDSGYRRLPICEREWSNGGGMIPSRLVRKIYTELKRIGGSQHYSPVFVFRRAERIVEGTWLFWIHSVCAVRRELMGPTSWYGSYIANSEFHSRNKYCLTG